MLLLKSVDNHYHDKIQYLVMNHSMNLVICYESRDMYHTPLPIRYDPLPFIAFLVFIVHLSHRRSLPAV